MHDPKGDFEPPALAARIRPGDAIDEFGELQPFDELIRPVARLPGTRPIELALEDEALTPGGRQIRSPELTDITDPPANLSRAPGNIDARDESLACLDRDERGEHAQRRRLAGPIRPEKAEYLALLDGDVDSTHGLDPLRAQAEGLGQHPCLDGGLAGMYQGHDRRLVSVGSRGVHSMSISRTLTALV